MCARRQRFVSVHPQAQAVPRNLLRFYVVFSEPMSEGYARDHLRLVDEHGTPLDGALLATDYELWDGAHRRLTVLLDPARIKRGLTGHRQAGYAIRIGQPFRLVIDAGFRDARGAPLRSGAVQHYRRDRTTSVGGSIQLTGYCAAPSSHVRTPRGHL